MITDLSDITWQTNITQPNITWQTVYILIETK